MKNTIDACVAFDFKGQHHELCVHLDLDQAMETAGILPSIYSLIARHNQIRSEEHTSELQSH